jgi:TIR domain
VNIFLSYPSAERTLAERLALALEAEGHTAFFDRSDLPEGEAFHQRLREAIQSADVMVYLVTPASVAPGSYTLAELEIARERWRRPSGHVLPVVVTPTPMASLPPYLSAVTVLQPSGEIVAETVAAVARIGGSGPAEQRRRIAIGAVGAVVLLGAATFAGLQLMQRRAEQAAMRADTAAAAQALQLCNDGSHEAAIAQFGELASHRPPAPAVLTQREDCAMRWMREMRAFSSDSGKKRSFDEQIAIVDPILLQALQKAQGARAADLRAHIGWGAHLRYREGTGNIDPVPFWQRALTEDAGNVYAHAMWAFRLMPAKVSEARMHFDRAVASGRELAYVRRLQFGASLATTDGAAAYAVAVADEMRRRGEAVTPAQRERLWTYAFGQLLGPEAREAIFAAVPAAQLKATFDWLFAGTDIEPVKGPTGRFVVATLQAHAGQRNEARAGFESLLKEHERTQALSYRIVNESKRALGELGKL